MLSCIPVEESSGSRSTAEGYRHDRARIDHHLAVLDEAVPGRCTTLDQHRSNRGGGLPDWPEWCLLPMAGPYAICKTADLVDLQRAERGPAAPMAALYAWRQGRSIYRFDPELAEAVVATDLTGEIPVDVFYSLPEWGIYIERPDETGRSQKKDWCGLSEASQIPDGSHTTPRGLTPSSGRDQLAEGADVGFESFDDSRRVGRCVSLSLDALHDPPAHQRGCGHVAFAGELLDGGQLSGIEPQREHRRFGSVRPRRVRIGWDWVVAVQLGVVGLVDDQPL